MKTKNETSGPSSTCVIETEGSVSEFHLGLHLYNSIFFSQLFWWFYEYWGNSKLEAKLVLCTHMCTHTYTVYLLGIMQGTEVQG